MVHLRIIEIFQVLLLLFALLKCSLVFHSFLVGIVKCHQVPHCNVGPLTRATECLVHYGIFQVKLVFYATCQDAPISLSPTHCLFILMETLKFICRRAPTVSHSRNSSVIFCIFIFKHTHGAFERVFDMNRAKEVFVNAL